MPKKRSGGGLSPTQQAAKFLGVSVLAGAVLAGIALPAVGALGLVAKGSVESFDELPANLKTPPLSSDYTMYLDERDGRQVIVCQVGKTTLLYDARAIDDLHAMLRQRGDWVDLGSADEQKPAKDGTVEAWGRSEDNPVGGWYGLKKGLRGRFANYVPPVLEQLGGVEVEHKARGNRMRAA